MLDPLKLADEWANYGGQSLAFNVSMTHEERDLIVRALRELGAKQLEMAAGVVERAARAMASIDGNDPDQVVWHREAGGVSEPWGSAWQAELPGAAAALSALRPGDVVSAGVVVPQPELADMEHRFACVLDLATCGVMSKTNYTWEAMRPVINDCFHDHWNDGYEEGLKDSQNRIEIQDGIVVPAETMIKVMSLARARAFVRNSSSNTGKTDAEHEVLAQRIARSFDDECASVLQAMINAAKESFNDG